VPRHQDGSSMVRADDPSAGSNILPISCSWVKTPTASSERDQCPASIST
jgi:hypothetical protein